MYSKSRGKFNSSINYYKKAIDLNPKSYEGLCNLSNAFLEIKNISNAIKYAKLAIKLDKSKLKQFKILVLYISN